MNDLLHQYKILHHAIQQSQIARGNLLDQLISDGLNWKVMAPIDANAAIKMARLTIASTLCEASEIVEGYLLTLKNED